MHRRDCSVKIHIVQKGDTLWKLAKKYGVSFEELKKLNTQLSNPDLLMPGMKLKIPGSAGNVKKEAVKPSQIVHKGVKEAQIPSAPPQVSKEEEQPIMQLKPKEEKQPIMQPKPVEKEKPVVVQEEVPIPEPVILQEDMANNYTLSMKEMQVTPVPEAKEEVKIPEAPKPPEIPQAPPVQIESMVQQPIETCIPVTPILPGTGFCYPPPPPIPQQWMQGQCEEGQMNPQVYEESPDVLGEFAIQAPVNANGVAGASMPGMMQIPTFNPYSGGFPQQPAQQYDGYESMNMQPSAQSYVQPAYQEEAEDCGCSKGTIGTYGPDKGKNPYPQAVYPQPNFSNASYQQPQNYSSYQQPLPGTPYQPPFGGTQVQPTYQEESEDCGCSKGSIGTYGPDKGKNPYPQAVYTQPSFSDATYQQPQNYSPYQQPLPGTPYQPPFTVAQTQPSYQQPGEQVEPPSQPSFGGMQMQPSYQQSDEQAESPSQPSFGGTQMQPSYQQPGEQAEPPSQPSFGGTQMQPSYQQSDEQAESPYQPPFGGTQVQPSYQQPGTQAPPLYQPSFAGTQAQPSYQQQPGTQGSLSYQPSFGGTQVQPPYQQQPGTQGSPSYQPPFGGTQVQPPYQQQPGTQAPPSSQPSFGGTQVQPPYQQQPGTQGSPSSQQPFTGTQTQSPYQQPFSNMYAQPKHMQGQYKNIQRENPAEQQDNPYVTIPFGGQPGMNVPGHFGGQPGPFIPDQFGGVRAPETFGMPTYAEESDDF